MILEAIRDERGRVIDFTMTNAHMTHVLSADTRFAGYSDGVNVYDAAGKKIAGSPTAIGLLFEQK